MAYLSALPIACPILGDNATAATALTLFRSRTHDRPALRGRTPRDFSATPYGAAPFASPFPEAWRIPRRDWVELIALREKQNARLADMLLASRPYLPSKMQGHTNYCWGNAVVTCLETAREVANLPYVEYSPASVCAPIKNFTNSGGWGGEALAYIVEHGIVPAELWPANAIERRYDNAATRAARQAHKITEWWDIPAGDFGALASILLRNLAAAIGLNWWRHEVAALDLVALDAGQFGVLCRNSWGEDYGDGHGMFVLSERKATPDDACAPAVITATAEQRLNAAYGLAL